MVFDEPEPNEIKKFFIEKNGVPKIAYAKIFAPKLLSKSIRKVVYLDTDILILRSLRTLFELKFEYSIAAAIDASEGHVGELKNAFNSGVIVMDLEKMRRKWSDYLLIAAFQENVESRWMDMTILRSIYKNDWYELPTSFNFIINGQDQKYFEEHEITLIHFAGGIKPWAEKSDSIFFAIWIWLRGNANQITRGDEVEGGQYSDLLTYIYPTLNNLYHKMCRNQLDYSWKSINSELSKTQAELSKTQAELSKTQAELSKTQAELQMIQKSRTWRIFGGYRFFRGLNLSQSLKKVFTR
jgi:lipopolysaccharide biosynthesis glycosyltransferase